MTDTPEPREGATELLLAAAGALRNACASGGATYCALAKPPRPRCSYCRIADDLDAAARRAGEGGTRAVVCVYCEEVIGQYPGDDDRAAIVALAKQHDVACAAANAYRAARAGEGAAPYRWLMVNQDGGERLADGRGDAMADEEAVPLYRSTPRPPSGSPAGPTREQVVEECAAVCDKVAESYRTRQECRGGDHAEGQYCNACARSSGVATILAMKVRHLATRPAGPTPKSPVRNPPNEGWVCRCYRYHPLDERWCANCNDEWHAVLERVRLAHIGQSEADALRSAWKAASPGLLFDVAWAAIARSPMKEKVSVAHFRDLLNDVQDTITAMGYEIGRKPNEPASPAGSSAHPPHPPQALPGPRGAGRDRPLRMARSGGVSAGRRADATGVDCRPRPPQSHPPPSRLHFTRQWLTRCGTPMPPA